jgi:hypothetical protein
MSRSVLAPHAGPDGPDVHELPVQVQGDCKAYADIETRDDVVGCRSKPWIEGVAAQSPREKRMNVTGTNVTAIRVGPPIPVI